MAEKFNLTANVVLKGPSNLKQFIDKLNKRVGGVTASVNLKVKQSGIKNVTLASKALDKAAKSASTTAKETKAATTAIGALGEQAAISAKRFGAFVLATAAFRNLIDSIRSGVKEAIDFQDEVVKIAQVTGRSVVDMRRLTDEIGRISKQFGVSSRNILEGTQILSQAGFTISKTQKLLETLAKVELSPTFSPDTKQNAEGLIAIFAQFDPALSNIEQKFGAINAVSKKFAVESSDIIAATKRAGGAFAAAGGSIEDFIGLFTSVRSTTRESAESIATGFRTIFTRLQRPRTLDFLETLGINLKNDNGLFVKPFEAIKELSTALKAVPTNDPRFSQIIEELGGFRQVSKVIPLIKEYDKAIRAKNIALAGGNSVDLDAIKRQESLAVQIQKVREELFDLIRTIGDNTQFRAFIGEVLTLSKSFIRLSETLVPLIPALSLLGAFKLTKAAPQFISGFKTKFKDPSVNFANGGKVPGVGNRDTVPAMLMPGEYVLNKQAVQKVGYHNLERINSKVQKFKNGGAVGKLSSIASENPVIATVALASIGQYISTLSEADSSVSKLSGSLAELVLKFSIYSGLLSVFNKKNKSVDLKDNTKSISDKISSIEKGQSDTKDIIIDLDRRLGGGGGSGRGKRRRRRGVDNSLSQLNDIYTTKQKRKLKTKLADVNPSLNVSNTVPFKSGDAPFPLSLEPDVLASVRLKQERERLAKVAKGNRRTDDLFFSNGVDPLGSPTKRRKRSSGRRGIKNPVGLAAGGLALIDVGSSFLRSSSEKQINAGTGGGAAGLAASVLGQAATGAAVGAQIGSFIPVLGPLIGAAIGGSIGGVRGAINDDSLSRESSAKFDKSIDGFSESLDKVSRGLATPASQLFELERGLKLFDDRIKNTTGDARTTAQGEFDNNLIGISEVFNKVASTSSDIDQFKSAIGNDTIGVFARLSNQTIPNVIKQFEEQIETQRDSIKAEREFARSTADFNRRINSINSFALSIERTADTINNFDRIISNSTDRIDKSSSFLDLSGASGRASNLSSFLGDNRFVGEINQAELIAKVLPGVLSNIRSSPLDQEGGVTLKIREELSKATGLGLNNSVISNLVSSINKQLGPSLDTTKFIKSLSDDFIGTIGGLTKNLTNVSEIFIKLENQVNSVANSFSKSLATARERVLELVGLQEKQISIEGDRISFFNNLSNRSDFRNRSNQESRNLGLLTSGLGTNSATGLGAIQRSAESNIKSLNDQLQNADRNSIEGIIRARETEQSKLEQATRALEFLSDASNRTAAAQNELTRIQSIRENRADFASSFAFGGREEQLSTAKSIQNAQLALAQGNLAGFSQEDKSGIKSVLEQFSDDKLFNGNTGENALKKILSGEFQRQGVSKGQADLIANKSLSSEEGKLIKQINDGFINAGEANAQLITGGKTSLTDLQQSIDHGFSENIRAIQGNFIAEQIKQAESNITSLSSDINKISSDFQSLNSLKGLGINSIEDIGVARSNLQNINQIKELDEQKAAQGQARLAIRSLINNEGLSGKDRANQARDKLAGILPKESINEITDLIGKEYAGYFSGPILREGDSLKIDEIFSQEFSSIEGKKRGLLESVRGSGASNKFISRSLGSDNEKLAAQLERLSDFKPGESKRRRDNLQQQKQNLQNEAKALKDRKSRLGFNSGGKVPGSGNTDTVPAMLTPGEFVLNKAAVSKIGSPYLHRLNSTGYNNGGSVGGNSVMLNTAELSQTINQFSRTSDRLSDAMNNFPREIMHTINGKVEVIINGAEVMTRIQPEIAELVEGKVKDGIKQFTQDNFPELG